ncbi:hypothetical protein PTTG_28502 [Puccinia triticina 1-1 BBBD Race 1]|uniref:Uncharacterized protein n=1 Tax=Puccinia triticina (isolate 1-1 / race 1 (BBBD)) TaxID=630390 RepID=A0A180GB49_PUCT1|nr:hypothetical protein PTTG_28502 [Puccinia triticina 1-1 BBBD Race 1]
MAEPDPLEEMLQYFTDSDKEDIPINTRGPSIDRRRYEGQLKLQSDYLSGTATYTDREFRRRFRITKTIFSRISNDLVNHDNYFLQKRDCCGVLGLSTEQKVTAALRILAYGVHFKYEYVSSSHPSSRGLLILASSDKMLVCLTTRAKSPSDTLWQAWRKACGNITEVHRQPHHHPALSPALPPHQIQCPRNVQHQI